VVAYLAATVTHAVAAHPSVRSVRLIGSRAEGRAHSLSDWDFAVETDDFAALAPELPGLLAFLEPVAAQWDRYSAHECYMLILRGPVKVDLLFLDERREWSPPWSPSVETLETIDRHFWDWILWVEQKRRHGERATLLTSLGHMHELMLGQLGVRQAPRSVAEAVGAYVEARAALERHFRTTVSRELEGEVRPVLEPA
jgi:hypothetical protein